MQIRHLRYFLAVVDEKTFTRAAKQNHIAQSALSEQIARLEETVGASLFARSSRSVRLTSAGECLVPLARRIIADVEYAQSELNALGNLRQGKIRLGLVESACSAIDAIDALARFHQEYPGVELQVRADTSAAMVEAVADGDLDLAVVGLAPEELPPGLKSQLLHTDSLIGIAASTHPLGGRDDVTAAEMKAQRPFVHFRPGSGLRTRVGAYFQRAGIEVPDGFAVGQISDIVRLVSRGVGVSIIPRSALKEPMAETITALGLGDGAARHPISIIHDPQRFSVAAQRFMTYLDLGADSPAEPHAGV